MAGWKLRKDKTPAETLEADAEAAAPAAQQSEGNGTSEMNGSHEPISLDAAPALPSFDSEPDTHFSEPDTHFTDLDFDSDPEEIKAEAPKSHEETPLTLRDYSEPEPEAAPVEAPTDEPDDFQKLLRTGRFETGELAPAPEFGFSNSGIPGVSPFVLDTPTPAAPPAAPPQLTVRFGRLSAAFPITKDVTTIGRPDSVLHYYPDVEIEMDDAVSRRHAEVVKRADGFYLVDTGSTNGTRLNGEILPAQEERLLAHGDRIRVGDRTEIVFE